MGHWNRFINIFSWRLVLALAPESCYGKSLLKSHEEPFYLILLKLIWFSRFIDFPSHSYPLAKDIVEVCQNYHTQGQTREKFEKISYIFCLSVFSLNPVTKEKIHVDLKIGNHIFCLIEYFERSLILIETTWQYLHTLYSNTKKQEHSQKKKSSSLKVKVIKTCLSFQKNQPSHISSRLDGILTHILFSPELSHCDLSEVHHHYHHPKNQYRYYKQNQNIINCCLKVITETRNTRHSGRCRSESENLKLIVLFWLCFPEVTIFYSF